MAQQGEEHISPNTAKYHPVDMKKVMPIVGLIIVAGLVALTSFTSKEQKRQDEEAGPVSTPVRTQSTEEFDKSLGRKLSENRLNELPQEEVIPPQPVKVPEYQDRREALRNAFRGRREGTGGKSIQQQHREEELKRALVSSRSSFSEDGQSRNVSFSPGANNAEESGLSNSARASREATAARQRYEEALEQYRQGGGELLAGLNRQIGSGNAQSDASSRSDSLLSGTSENPAFPSGYAGSNSTFFAVQPKGTKTILAGTVILMVTETKIVSDYVGTVKARVSRDVFSRDGLSVIIPAGSVVLARSSQITGENQAINNRLAVTAPTIIRPDGLKIDLRDLSLLDAAGVGGLKGSTNYHFVAQALATVAYAGTVALGSDAFIDELDLGGDDDSEPPQQPEQQEPVVARPTVEVVTTTNTTTTTTVDAEGNEVETTIVTTEQTPVVLQPVISSTTNTGSTISVSQDSNSETLRAEIAGEFATKLADVFQPVLDKYFSLVPTVTIPAGTRMNLIIEKDIYASPWSNLYDEFN